MLSIIYLNIYKVLDKSEYSEKINLFLEIHKHFEIIKSSYGAVGEKPIEDLFIERINYISDIEGDIKDEMKNKFIEIIKGEEEEKFKEEEDRLRKEKEAEELKKAEEEAEDRLRKSHSFVKALSDSPCGPNEYRNTFNKDDIFYLTGEVDEKGWVEAYKISDEEQTIKKIPFGYVHPTKIKPTKIKKQKR